MGSGKKGERSVRLVPGSDLRAALAQRAPGWRGSEEGQLGGVVLESRSSLYLAGAHGVGAAQGQVPLEQHFGREFPQAQLPPGDQ